MVGNVLFGRTSLDANNGCVADPNARSSHPLPELEHVPLGVPPVQVQVQVPSPRPRRVRRREPATQARDDRAARCDSTYSLVAYRFTKRARPAIR